MSVLKHCFLSTFGLHWESSLDSSDIPKFKQWQIQSYSCQMHLGWTHCHFLKARIIWVGLCSCPRGTFYSHLKHSWLCCIFQWLRRFLKLFTAPQTCVPTSHLSSKTSSLMPWVATSIFLLLWPNEHSWTFISAPCFPKWESFLFHVKALQTVCIVNFLVTGP